MRILTVSAFLLAGISGAAAQSITTGGNATTTSNALTFNAGPQVVLVKCNKMGDATPPSDCHLTEGHTLDEVMAVLWQQNEDRRAMYQSEAEMLKRRVKLIPPQKVKAKPPVASVEESR